MPLLSVQLPTDILFRPRIHQKNFTRYFTSRAVTSDEETGGRQISEDTIKEDNNRERQETCPINCERGIVGRLLDDNVILSAENWKKLERLHQYNDCVF
ncbi:hypothetical protein J6590_026016 [Homalodisca vitripennis]|nr:hypothetical protein J6590_026016 [Homalodisca vitripennis]